MTKMERAKIEKAKIVQVVKVIATIGEGTPTDPHRTVAQYWSVTGKLLAEIPLESEEDL